MKKLPIKTAYFSLVYYYNTGDYFCLLLIIEL